VRALLGCSILTLYQQITCLASWDQLLRQALVPGVEPLPLTTQQQYEANQAVPPALLLLLETVPPVSQML
jgi:hypothetical protein